MSEDVMVERFSLSTNNKEKGMLKSSAMRKVIRGVYKYGKT